MKSLVWVPEFAALLAVCALGVGVSSIALLRASEGYMPCTSSAATT